MPQWTKDQLTAIQNRGGALLVSAAAGSGKTAVLVERVVTRLSDPDDPVDIDRLLLVTFTNAAAAEMRERIGRALGEAAAQNPRDARLRRQLFLVHRAKITTVHALCLSLAREQAAALGIAPDFRLMDENEGKILRAEVLEETLDAAYERGDKGFLALCEQLAAGRDDKKLGEVILSTYEKIQAHPDPRAFLAEVREGLYARGMDTPHGRVLLAQARAAAEHGAAFLRKAADEVTGVDELAGAYLPALTSDLHQAERLLDALRGGDWDACVEAARSISFDRLKAVRGFEDKALLEEIKAMREEWKTAAKAIRDRWLTVTAAEADGLKAVSEKLEVINLQLARIKAARRRTLHWLLIALCAAIIIVFAVLAAMGSSYLGWDYSDPGAAVAGTFLHGFEWLFVRLAPFVLIAAAIGIFLTRKRK